MKEIWGDIPNYENLYQVSNLGRVRSLDRVVKNHLYKGKVLSPTSNGLYLKVGLSKNGKKRCMYIHILVAIVFLNFDISKGYEINHIDHNKLNNIVTNLEVVTHKENMNKALDFYGGVKNKYGFNKKVKHKSVFCIDCGKSICENSVRCVSCANKYRCSIKLSELPVNLPNLVSDIGVVATARKYNVSHTTIRRWLRKFGEVV